MVPAILIPEVNTRKIGAIILIAGVDVLTFVSDMLIDASK